MVHDNHPVDDGSYKNTRVLCQRTEVRTIEAEGILHASKEGLTGLHLLGSGSRCLVKNGGGGKGPTFRASSSTSVVVVTVVGAGGA